MPPSWEGPAAQLSESGVSTEVPTCRTTWLSSIDIQSQVEFCNSNILWTEKLLCHFLKTVKKPKLIIHFKSLFQFENKASLEIGVDVPDSAQ